MSALLLVGMSASDVDRREELQQAAQDLQPGASIAFLQMADPSLSRELTRLADEQVDRITLVGVNLGTLGPAHSWLRRVAGHWWRERTGLRPVVDVSTRLAKSLDEIRIVLPAVKPIAGTEAPLTSQAWDEVPRHRHQVLVCRGPRCTARGSDATARALDVELKDRGLGDDDVLVTQTGCLFPCNHAPVVSVQPDDTWYGAVDPEVVCRIVTEHLIADRPLEARRLSRSQARS
ncbi:(2Fe-2S) ferredoxin domain-containing protein [Aeromicrobium sp. P5_D10]